MGKVEKTRFERNWTTFVNPAFCPAWKSPLKMVVWNRPRGIRSQGCCFVSPRWGKSKKRVLNAIGRRSSTRLFAMLGKAHSKWWYETDLVEFDPKGVVSFRPDGESRKNAFWTQLDDVRQPGFLPCLEKPTQNGGMKPTSWYSIVRVFSFRPDGESRKNAFWTQLDDVRQPGFLPCLEKPTQNGGMKPNSWYSILRVFFRLARWGKSKKRVLNAIGRRSSTRLFALLGKAHSKWWYETDLVVFDPKGVFSFRPDGEGRKNAFWTQLDDVRQPGFCPAWKSPLKMVVWNRPRGIRSQGCCFVSPRWGKSKKRVLNAIGRRSSTRLFALLGKAHSKWWYETDLVVFDRKGFFVSPRWGKSKKRVLNAIGRRSSTRLFALLGKAHSKWWYETELVVFDPKGVFSFGPMRKVEKTRFERNWTTFVNPAFCPAWKSPLKMVVWNRPCGIRS